MDRGTETTPNDRIIHTLDNIVKREMTRVEKELNRFKKRLTKTPPQGGDEKNEKAELWNLAGLLIFGNTFSANNTFEGTSQMSSEESVPGEGAQEAELQAIMSPSDPSSVISTPPDSTVPEDPARSPLITPASVSPPGEIKIESVEINSVSLSWGSPDNMDGIPHSFHITYSSSDKSHQDSITAPSNSTVISELRPGREYSFTVTTVLENGTQSTPVSTSACTKLHFVDQHCYSLIQRVVAVATVADALLGKRMLQDAQYDEVLVEKVPSAQMRLLYKFSRAWGNSEKDVFLEILEKQQPHLIRDLRGD
ncbi:uncharacterized protein LOC121305141 [Polyodon spathula]|uniref:uncharacterized protein LOC121305141 n=1 Tax=Polyodon spathula TaxID=7913 RepID=UPI001B7E87A1|nr:uncharacterized protein LOC121305141 [Polyodon spathula]